MIDVVLRIDPENAGALSLRERVQRAWDAERAIGTWADTGALPPARAGS